ncbi:MAG: type II secretion system protein [bacterium]
MKKRAFTLIETMVVVAIGAGMMAVLGVLIYNFNKTFVYQQALIESSGSASAIIREMESLAMPANAVLQTRTFSGSTYTSTSTSIVLEIPSIDSSGNVISNTYDYAVFYSVGANAYRLLEANVLSKRYSGTKQLSSAVSSLTFSYNNVDYTKVSTVTIDVQTQTRVKQDILSDHRREQIRLRNY